MLQRGQSVFLGGSRRGDPGADGSGPEEEAQMRPRDIKQKKRSPDGERFLVGWGFSCGCDER